MKALQCEMCGSQDLVKDGGVFVCQSCGTKYTVEEAKKMMVEGTVDVKGTVKVDTSDELKNLYEIARRAKDAENSDNAAKYYDMIESISEQDGYYVLLKQGFTNDVTGSRTIHAENLKDIRIMITKSHPVRTGQLVDGVNEVTAEWLRKWQTPRKYYHMIESATFTREDGFTIVLKEGFTNDATGSRLIHSDSLKVFKPLIKHSHSV